MRRRKGTGNDGPDKGSNIYTISQETKDENNNDEQSREYTYQGNDLATAETTGSLGARTNLKAPTPRCLCHLGWPLALEQFSCSQE